MKPIEHNRTPISTSESGECPDGRHQGLSAEPLPTGAEVIQTPYHTSKEREVLCSIASRYLDVAPLGSKADFDNFLAYMEKMGLVITGYRIGSLVITVKCDSLNVLKKLWEDYSSGRLGKVVQRCFVTQEILTELSLEELKLGTTILEEEYKVCKGFFDKESARGASKKTNTKPRAKASKQAAGTSKKTTTKQRAKPQAKVPKQGSSKKLSSKQRAKPQAKVPKQSSSKKTSSKQRAKPQAKVPKQNTSKKTTTKQKAKPQAQVPKQVNLGALKLTSTMQRTTPPTIVNQSVTNVISSPPPVTVQLGSPFNKRAYNYDQEGHALKRKKIQSQPSFAPGSELPHEAYAQEGPPPKRKKGREEEIMQDDSETEDSPAPKKAKVSSVDLEEERVSPADSEEERVQSQPSFAPGSELPHEAYAQEGPPPKRKKDSEEEIMQDDSETEDSPAPKKAKVYSVDLEEERVSPADSEEERAVRTGVPNEDVLESLANDISSSWQKLGRRLGIPEAKLTAFERQNHDLSEQAYKMLLHWKESRAQAATYSVLFEALSDERVGQSELAVKYCFKK